MLRTGRLVDAVYDPPVAEAKRGLVELRAAGDLPLLDVSQAVPSHPPAPELRAHVAALIRTEGLAAYAPTLGLESTRAAAADHFGAYYDASVPIDHVMITSGCNQAFCLAIGALCDPGDEVVVPVPWYFNHEMWLRANGIEPVAVPAEPSADLQPDVGALERAITARTRAIVLVTPNNPCGVVYPEALLDAAFEVARRRGIALILDETYKDFRPTTDPPHRLFARPDWAGTLVHLFSFSKVFSLAGYRAGSLVAAPHVLAAAAKLADCQTIAAPRVAQEAVTFGLTELAAWVEDHRIEMQRRVERFAARMADFEAPFVPVASGAYFAYVRHPYGEMASAVVARRLLDEQAVLTIPGSSFGPGQDDYLRVAFGNIDLDGIDELARRLARA